MTRPTYKRAARSSFAVPQVPARRQKLDHSGTPEVANRHFEVDVNGMASLQQDVQDLEFQCQEQEHSERSLSEFPFPHQLRSQNVDTASNPHRIPSPDLETSSEGRSAFTQIRSTRMDSFCSEYSPFTCPSPMPSLASSDPWSPLSPATPQTPADIFGSAAHSLRQLVMADELGMTVEEIKELDDFATLSVSGSDKRGGRVLPRRVYRETRQRLSTSSSRRCSDQARRRSSLRAEQPRFQSCEEWTNQVDSSYGTKDWWREVNWSRFSDSSSDCPSDSDMEDAQRPTQPRRTSSYRGCIFLPPTHELKLPFLKDMVAEPSAKLSGII